MKTLLGLCFSILVLSGCVTSSDSHTDIPKYFLANGEYQSADNELLFTADYPNWSAKYYAKTPVLLVSGVVDSIRFDSSGVVGNNGPEYIKFYAAHYTVKSKSQTAADGTKIDAPSDVLKAAGFSVSGDSFSTTSRLYYEIKLTTTISVDSSFTFTGHKLR